MDDVRTAPFMFDTLRLAQELRDEVKLAPEQAEKLAAVLTGAFAKWQEQQQLVTKADLAAAEGRLEKLIVASKFEILKWVFSMIGLQTLIILGALIALLHNIGKL